MWETRTANWILCNALKMLQLIEDLHHFDPKYILRKIQSFGPKYILSKIKNGKAMIFNQDYRHGDWITEWEDVRHSLCPEKSNLLD